MRIMPRNGSAHEDIRLHDDGRERDGPTRYDQVHAVVGMRTVRDAPPRARSLAATARTAQNHVPLSLLPFLKRGRIFLGAELVQIEDPQRGARAKVCPCLLDRAKLAEGKEIDCGDSLEFQPLHLRRHRTDHAIGLIQMLLGRRPQRVREN